MNAVSDEMACDLVRKALADPRWDFRTISGISRATGLSEEKIVTALGELRDEIRQSAVRSRSGELLFTLRDRPKKLQEKIAALQQMIGF